MRRSSLDLGIYMLSLLGALCPFPELIIRDNITFRLVLMTYDGTVLLWGARLNFFRISFVDEMGICTALPPSTSFLTLYPVQVWNLHTRLSPDLTPIATAYISQWKYLPPFSSQLEPDEVALQNLLLGITYRSLSQWKNSKEALIQSQSLSSQLVVSSSIPGWAGVEYAVTLLHQVSASTESDWENRVGKVRFSPIL